MLKKISCFLLATFIFVQSSFSALYACTRAVYFGKEGQVVTGRTADWFEDTKSNIYVFPRAMERDGATNNKPLKWKSKYGSVVISSYEAVTMDGMNEASLVANLLYLSETEYPKNTGKKPEIAISVWTQYVLDNFATVKEAVNELKKEKFVVAESSKPGSKAGTVHLSISDPTGDSAIFEYVNGKLVIHHGKQYQVMTNSPTYDKQLALNEYWKNIGGTVMLPGTNRASDRFARTSFYINAAEQSSDPRKAVAATFSVMRNASVPIGITTEGQPNIASTIWRTVADHKNKIYYFESTLSPNIVWLNLNEIDFSPSSQTRKLQLDGNLELVGNQTKNLVVSKPFEFLR